ncbi:3-hydroxyacyl-CoA dehydrogenase family protein [Auritidibacter sp. NML100628]|uniref:3-hydroxyacyl-CoA dehydrogenase family protein n=1 Tax=Auritidibacter sp. NML100628 TaxID=2170742 RepID=UPI000D7375CD|nr:3-hydroxyacyl-CoA dehydrogenase family protein [Auritidibacter sp. NML100628]PXA77001.1 3-hydroxyacyl-CoA dehydrogenase [Auritidibacter sp. NML100628]
MVDDLLQNIRRIAVIGSGTMGSQISMACALAGFETTVVDIVDEALEKAEASLRSRMERDVSKGRRQQADVDAAFDRLSFSTDSDQVVSGADVVIEAATENLEIKRKLFAGFDQAAPEHTILATNSSTIVSSQVADATNRADKVCNFHFFNPALVMKAVEIVPNDQTSTYTIEVMCAVAQRLGKHVVQLHREIPGFVANRLMNALRDEALNLYQAGIASYEDIDVAARDALGHPMGPFELMDLVGIDVSYFIDMAEYDQTGQDAALPHPVLKEKYETGDYGRKTGRGWYNYEN